MPPLNLSGPPGTLKESISSLEEASASTEEMLLEGGQKEAREE